jgi:hypothetical protein
MQPNFQSFSDVKYLSHYVLKAEHIKLNSIMYILMDQRSKYWYVLKKLVLKCVTVTVPNKYTVTACRRC